VDVLSGAFMMMRRSALEKSGLLDEDFFMYGEDVDLSYRIQKAGYKNYYFPEVSLIHFKGESTRRGSISFVRNFYKAMLLFSGKHFSRNRIFSLFIWIGIGIRAFLALSKRLFDFSAGFVLEFTLAFLGMAFIKNWWELNFKGVPGLYPDVFIELLIPGYLLVWLFSIRLTAAYSRDESPMVILKGIILGTILISGVTNFFDDYRFSKGLILIGAAWTWSVCTAKLVVLQLIRSRKLLFNLKRKKRVLISGDEKAYQNAMDILSKFSQDVLVCGRCGRPDDSPAPGYLGKPESLAELSFRLGLDELIFCQDGMSNAAIIEGVEKYRKLNLRFSILAPGGRYLVSSSEKHNRGQIMQSDSRPELLQVHNLRLKRLCDLGICLLLLPLIPLISFRVQSVTSLFRHYAQILAGNQTWVGTSTDAWQRYGLRPAVITTSVLAGHDADKSLIDSMDKLYIQEFLAEHEVWTVLKNLKHLGNKNQAS